MKKRIGFAALVLAILFVVSGWLFGFPNEKAKLRAEVQKYVETRYDLTPTDIQVSFSIDGMDVARVMTKEYPFGFDVSVSREEKKAVHDLYLEALAEYCMEKRISDKIGAVPSGTYIHIRLETRFSKTNPQITPEEIQAEPDGLFNNPAIRYYCSVSGKETDLQKYYPIFSKITEVSEPSCVYIDIEKNAQSVCIKKEGLFKNTQRKRFCVFCKIKIFFEMGVEYV